MRMEDGDANSERTLDRVISQKALQMSSSPTCKSWALGFFFGLCSAYLASSLLSPLRISLLRSADLQSSSPPYILERKTSVDDFIVQEHTVEVIKSSETDKEAKIMDLYFSWSSLLDYMNSSGRELSDVPRAPHLENCRSNMEKNRRFDRYSYNMSFPPWMLWRGALGLKLFEKAAMGNTGQQDIEPKGLYPPWITGSDEENYPMTRRVQTDLWLHQHPRNCSETGLRFLAADWERIPGFGIGAQIAGMSGLLAIAVKEQRILVTNYYNRADHNGCKGASRSRWSCYFFPETSAECRERAMELLKKNDSIADGIITVKENYTSKEIWTGRTPRLWGEPWRYMQPTTSVGGSLLAQHRKMDRRWWIAQAARYLMRFRTKYMCSLLNVARHSAFGYAAAKMVVESLMAGSPQPSKSSSPSDIEEFVWAEHGPYVPRPLLSMHVRMGDKSCEMEVFEFEKYMELAERIRRRFPDLNSIWLSTEMQEVVDKAGLYPHWNFYYTNVSRQTGNTSMAAYEASLGRETSTNYPLVNLVMAAEADFFVGALGSTWCYLIDGMRNTGGKVMSAYLSVNKDRFW